MKAETCDGEYCLPCASTQASPLPALVILNGTSLRSRSTSGSSERRPIRRLIAKKVLVALVTACRLAGSPTSFSPSSVNATIDGVVFKPSALMMTFGVDPSMTATHELVVPRSIPMTLLIFFQSLCLRQTVGLTRTIRRPAPTCPEFELPRI